MGYDDLALKNPGLSLFKPCNTLIYKLPATNERLLAITKNANNLKLPLMDALKNIFFRMKNASVR
jgi:hypothetical protein